MKLGFTKGLLGVLVAVSCGFPSVVFGQQNECDKTMTWPVAIGERDAIENEEESYAVASCKQKLNDNCRAIGGTLRLRMTIDSPSIESKTLEGTKYKVTCNGLCRCTD